MYSIIQTAFVFTQDLPPRLLNVTHKVSELVHGLLFPLVSHNSINVHGEPKLMVINGTRSDDPTYLSSFSSYSR